MLSPVDQPEGYIPGEEKIKIDRNRFSRKLQKRLTVVTVELQKAEKDLDSERVNALLEEMDQITSSVVVAIPDEWFLNGATMKQADWMDHLPTEKYNRLMKLSGPQEPGAPKA